MSSNVYISGASSGLDTESMIKALVSSQQSKKDVLVQKQTKLQWKRDAWKTLNSKIYAFQNKTVNSLKYASDYKKMTTSVSDTGYADVVSGTNAMKGVQNLHIDKIAKAGYLTGNKVARTDGATTAVSSDTKLSDLGTGSITVKIGSGEEKTLSFETDATVADAISQLKELGLNANFDEKNQRINISAGETGVENDFTITGSGTLFTNMGLDATKQQDAQDASITLNNVTYTSASNTIEVNGLSITLKKAMESDTDNVTLNTYQDTSAMYSKIKSFITEYATLINEMDSLLNVSTDDLTTDMPYTDDEKEDKTDEEIKTYEANIKKSILAGDDSLETVFEDMKGAMRFSMTIDGTTYSLDDFGIKKGNILTTSKGEQNAYHIEGDADDSMYSSSTNTLQSMINSDPDTVVEFFTGLAKSLYKKMDETGGMSSTSSFGCYYNDKKLLADYKEYTTLIATQEDRIESATERYKKQFTAMETALTELNAIQSSLSGLLGG